MILGIASIKKFILLFFSLLISSIAICQKYNNNFDNPMKLDLIISGNYGELRPNHFHSGIDFKTNGREREKIYSITDGYVSRINISPWGYGKSVYITHPNGYTSVYAHISNYNIEIETYIKSLQYKNKTYSIDTLLPKGFITIKKGEFIAFSGNTGNSFGPHLHFEIRTTNTEHPVNPLLFGYNIKDNKAPKIYSLVTYNLNSDLNNPDKNISTLYKLTNSYLTKDTIYVNRKTGMGIEVYDFVDLSTNKCAPYKLSLYKNNILIYSIVADEFDFSEKRYVNAHIDYARYLKNRKKIHKLYVEPNDKFSLYKNVVNRGIIELHNNETANIKIIAEDFNKNKTEIKFVISAKNHNEKKILKSRYILNYNKENIFANDSIKITIPNNALYNNLDFKYLYLAKNKYRISSEYIPLFKKIKVELKPFGLEKKYFSKTVIIRISKKGHIQALPSKYNGKYFSTYSDKFGVFSLMIDTIKPRIKPVNIFPDAKFIKDNKIRVKITDNLSGIKSYNAYIDGKWVLFEYDAKKANLTYYFDNKVPANETYHNLKIIVKDSVGNTAIYKVRFFH